jgi:hypothetical protein
MDVDILAVTWKNVLDSGHACFLRVDQREIALAGDLTRQLRGATASVSLWFTEKDSPGQAPIRGRH